MEPTTEVTTTEVTTPKLTIEIAIEKLEAEYPNGVELYYVDYGDSLDDNKKILQDIIETGYTDEDIMQWRDDNMWETMDIYIQQTFTAEEQEEIDDSDDDLRSNIQDWLYSNDHSDVMKGLLRNTNDKLCLVDLDYYFENPEGMDEEEREAMCIAFLGHINEDITDTNLSQVKSIYNEAYYGGTAYAMIQADMSDFYGDDKKAISLSDLKLGIIDTRNGSGDYGDVDISKPIVCSRQSIVLDDSIDYGVNSIFGGGIEGSNGYKLIDEVVEVVVPGVKKEIEDEEQRKKDYAKNKCAGFGCHKFKYHTTEYRNDYPAGNTCKICGRFWID